MTRPRQFKFRAIRNLTSPDGKFNGVQTYFANIPVGEILKFNTKDNLRAYIAEHNPKRRNGVHAAIRDTIPSNPDKFIVRNSGFTVTASQIEVDEGKKLAVLSDVSIINGAESQGEIRQFFKDLEEEDDDDEPAFMFALKLLLILLFRSPLSKLQLRGILNRQLNQFLRLVPVILLEKEVRKYFPKFQLW